MRGAAEDASPAGEYLRGEGGRRAAINPRESLRRRYGPQEGGGVVHFIRGRTCRWLHSCHRRRSKRLSSMSRQPTAPVALPLLPATLLPGCRHFLTAAIL